jgi:tetratricopeptide (TPR) repeat protein/Zn-dependent protease
VALKFKLLDVPVAIGVDFVAVMALLGLLLRTPEQLPAWLIVATLSVLLHEVGHAAMFDFYGIPPSIRLYGGGGMTTGLRLPSRQHILVVAAGPAVGLAIGGMVGLAVLAAPRLATDPVIQDLLWFNLGLSSLNLLPLPGVDGAAVLDEVVTLVLGRPAEVAARVVGVVLLGAIVIGLALVGQVAPALFVAWVAASGTIRIGGASGFNGGTKKAGPSAQLLRKGLAQEAFNAACVEMADRPADPDPVLVAATALLILTRYGDAETGFNEMLRRDPTNAPALAGRAETRRRQGRMSSAEADLQTLLGLQNPEAIAAQAAALYQAGRLDEGCRLTMAALPKAQNVVVARMLEARLASFEMTLGRELEALGHADALVRAEPGRPDLHELRALILCCLGRLDEANAAATKALAGATKHPEFLETLGIVERLSGNPTAAMPRLVDAAVARPNLPRGRAELALCQVQLGRVPEAKAALASLPEYAAGDPFVVYARAAAALADGGIDTATALLREVQRLRPDLGLRAGVDPLFRGLAAAPPIE